MRVDRITQILLAALVAAASAGAQDYDLVIRNGRVMDPESGFDAVANVGINNGFVTKISTETLEGARVIDATGHVVAPGFVDYHSHGQEPYAFRLYARDGVTTAMDLEMGSYPVGEYYDYWKGQDAAVNYGTAVSHAFARLQVLDGVDAGGRTIYRNDVLAAAFRNGQQWKSKLFDPQDEPAILDAMEDGLKAGGLGIAFPIGYYSIVGSPEVMAVGGLVKKYDTFATSHVRYLAQIPPSGYLGMEEMLHVAGQNDIPLYLFHIPSNCLGLTKQCLDLIDAARASGQSVVGEFLSVSVRRHLRGRRLSQARLQGPSRDRGEGRGRHRHG